MRITVLTLSSRLVEGARGRTQINFDRFQVPDRGDSYTGGIAGLRENSSGPSVMRGPDSGLLYPIVGLSGGPGVFNS